MNELERYFLMGRKAGCPADQMDNFHKAGIILQPRQLAASAAARRCDEIEGPTEIGYGGARGGGKSYWLLAQMGADDCQRVPGLKCLLLRKVGKANREHFEDLRHALFAMLPHTFAAYRGVLTFANGSKIVAGHFQAEKDIDAYLGLEYDVIGIEEATTLSRRKYEHIRTCCRSSKELADGQHWRPRIYSTTNPGGVGHAWYRARFIAPYTTESETETRFIPARVTDNPFANPEYTKVLESLSGWQRRAWLDGDWDIAAGQFFTTFRREVHIVSDPPLRSSHQTLNSQPSTLNYFDPQRAREWFASLDYGFTHYTVFLLGCTDSDGNTFIVDEHAERLWLPERHAYAIHALLARHGIRLPYCPFKFPAKQPTDSQLSTLNPQLHLSRIVAGTDVFARQSDGTTVADQYRKLGIKLKPANMDRQNGWAEILSRLGDPSTNTSCEAANDGQSGSDLSTLSSQLSTIVRPRLFIHKRCTRLCETIPALQHDPNHPEDVLKVDADENGIGGDDAADALRYLLATKPKVPGCAVA